MNSSRGFWSAPSITVPSPKIIILTTIVFSGSGILYTNSLYALPLFSSPKTCSRFNVKAAARFHQSSKIKLSGCIKDSSVNKEKMEEIKLSVITSNFRFVVAKTHGFLYGFRQSK